jgi:hypothetical protein
MEKKEKKIILKVCKQKSNGQKYVTIPKHSEIEPGDYIEVRKVK